ncbi:MAG: hypothetical protein JXC31_04910, partial [Acholeplasmataceae bacterium]|nr:hypothetical protein [Acholeplasmataceae bacterium]
MNRLKHLFKQNAYFMITLIVLLLSLTFAGITLAVFSVANTVDQTSLGFIYLGSYDEDQYESILNSNIEKWKTDSEYKLQYQDYSYDIPLNLVEFNYSQTRTNLIKNQDNLAYFDVSSSNVALLEENINQQFTSTITDYFDFDQFYQDFYTDIQHLKERRIYDLTEYTTEEFANLVINQNDITNINPLDVDIILNQITEINIAAGDRFSLLTQLETLELNNEQLSIIASGMLGVLLDSNFNGFSFEQYYTMPTWAVSGQNVRILKVNQFDFTFYNDFDLEYQVLIEKSDANTLTFSLIGYPYITEYSTTSVFQVTIPFQTVYIDNSNIDELTPLVIT